MDKIYCNLTGASIQGANFEGAAMDGANLREVRAKAKCANTTQVGGSHYKDLAIQPVEYIMKNNLGYCEGNVVKYVTRWKDKGGIEDLQKAKHFIDILIEGEDQ